jgi:hypothetical protein
MKNGKIKEEMENRREHTRKGKGLINKGQNKGGYH